MFPMYLNVFSLSKFWQNYLDYKHFFIWWTFFFYFNEWFLPPILQNNDNISKLNTLVTDFLKPSKNSMKTLISNGIEKKTKHLKYENQINSTHSGNCC